MVSTAPSLIPVLADHACAIGCLLKRGKQGFEAYDRDNQSLGLLETSVAAMSALIAAASTPPEPEAA